MAEFWVEMLRRIIAKGGIYWLLAIVFGFVGIGASMYAAKHWPGFMLGPKFAVYELFSGPRQGQAHESTAVIILDNDFAHDFAGRTPLKRDVVGLMVTNLCAAGARVVALDINMPSESGPSGTSKSDSYSAESVKFRDYVQDVLAPPDVTHPWRNPLCRIVLTVPLDCDERPCKRISQTINASDFQSARVTEGAANLASGDIRKMPIHQIIADDVDEPSLSWAAARAYEASVGLNDPPPANEFPYISFLTEADLSAQKRLIPTPTVLNSSCATTKGKNSPSCLELSSIVQGKIVLVGGAWHDFGHKLHDGHDTPVGQMPGVLVHLNFVAAYLDKRLTYPFPHGLGFTLELVTVVVLALVTACIEGTVASLALLLLGGFFLFVCEYILWVSFGFYYDAIVPMIFLFLHSHIHDYVMIKIENRKTREQKQSD